MTSLPILVPPGFSPLVQQGDSVTVGQTLAQKTLKEEELINIPRHLEIPLRKVKNVLKKVPGDAIVAGDIIATKKGLFGIRQSQIISSVNGIVSRYERDTGNLAIKTSQQVLTKNLVSPVDGTVSLCDNKKIVISTDKNVLSGKRASGKRVEGEVFILEQSFQEHDPDSLLYLLGNQAEGKIVVGGKFPKDLIVKAIGVGAKGIIGEEIEDEQIDYIAQKMPELPIMQIAEKEAEKLIQWKGKKIFFDPGSQSIILLQI